MRRRTFQLALCGLIAGPARSQATQLDINRASRAELESLNGLGPAMVERILQARQQAPFEDWQDLQQRVRGLRRPSLLKLSAQGLRVAGRALSPDTVENAASASESGKERSR